MTLKIEKDPRYEKRAIELKAQGKGRKVIADILNREFPEIRFTAKDVGNFFQKRDKVFGQVLRKSAEIRKETARKYLNTIDQLEELNKEMWALFYSVKEADKVYTLTCPACHKTFKYTDKDYQNIVKMADHILKQLQLNAELLGELKKASYSVTYNIHDLSLKFLQVVKDFERKGYIKIINKKRMKELQNEV